MDPKKFIKNLEDNFKLTSSLFSDIQFKNTNIQPYSYPDDVNGFGEKDSLLYTADFMIFNVNFSMKFLSLLYNKHGEILKLEILIHNDLLEKEVCSCRNFLQRKRNLNGTFETLIHIANLYESRRLICKTVLEKNGLISLKNQQDGGIQIICNSYDRKEKFVEVHWILMWNLEDCKLFDFIEFFCNKNVLAQDEDKIIRMTLEKLSKVDLDFRAKLKLWKLLIDDLYDVQSVEMNDVLEISDTESDIIVVNGPQESIVVLD